MFTVCSQCKTDFQTFHYKPLFLVLKNYESTSNVLIDRLLTLPSNKIYGVLFSVVVAAAAVVSVLSFFFVCLSVLFRTSCM